MIELTPFLNKRLNVPLYVQLYNYIKSEIEAGEIPEGSSLPSIRYLSEHLRISKNTIENAYQQLVAEGYVESKPRSGLKVLPMEKTLTSRQNIKNTMRIESDFVRGRMYPYDFKYGDVDSHHFPLKKWKRCLQDSLEGPDAGLYVYGDEQGDKSLRKEIASYLFQARGVTCSPEQIVICAGTQHAISLICQLLSLHGKSVAFENPGYDGVRSVFENHGCHISAISLESDGLDLNRLEESRENLVYITPSHQFPYGMVLPIQKRQKLLDWAHKNKSYIIEDDYDSEFRYQGQPIPSLKALDTKENVIYLGTFSKSFLPAARLSYMVVPSRLVKEFKQKLNYNQSAPLITQRAMSLFMKDGSFERHVRKMKKVYHGKHNALLHAIETHLSDNVEVIGSKAGLHILLRVNHRDSSQELVRKAGEYGVKVYSPEKYWLDKEQSPSSLIMLGFGGMTEEQIEAGICLLKKAWY
ncbi:PLP-dependent aminotransferase family protein [Bacillus sp. CECT 9360]|uniref:MocR-like pyridoxine biosynthesis transcription factor PdxR n=1 Tax=Bacillus sp. CECT 9360 TaxID=2845821 RepID=UPI001E361EBF|nr:PLP-dependent aminotransferase family protein [Bacillus sp. CECT 9360]CAH0344946.1 HTH-type transcriptional regulatory protein GabR [Bacillus sp. CECT 9360]